MVLIAWKNNRNDPSGDLTQGVFASYFMPGLTAPSPLLSLEWNAFIWDLGPNIRGYSHIHSNKKLAIHFLSVTWEFLITEWFFAAICYSSIKQIINSQVIKITKKQENVSNFKSSFVHDQRKQGDRASLETPLFEIPTGLTPLSARTRSVTVGKEVSLSCGSAPGCEVDGSLTRV